MLLVSSPGLAQAQDPGLDLHTLERKTKTAERRIRTWNARLERWHERIAKSAMAVERLTDRVEGSEPIALDGLMHGFPTRELGSHRLARAHERLRKVLKDHSARRALRELETWSSALAELQLARDHLVGREQHVEPTKEPALKGPATYESWARAFLSRVSAPTCAENLAIVVTWETSESTDAAFNPLATTHAMEGATDFNSVGVKNYRSLDQGLDAARDTLQGGAESYGYGAILSSLQACATAEATAVAINASAWCRGCVGGAYITGLLPIVRADYASHASRLISTGV